MSDAPLVVERLEHVRDAIGRIMRRFNGITTADSFLDSNEGGDRLDAICMALIGIGETLKHLDRMTHGALLARYPDIDWKGVKAVRDVIAHGYFDIDAEEVFGICRNDIPELLRVVQEMIDDIGRESSE